MRTTTKALVAGGAATIVVVTGGVAAAATGGPSTTAGQGHRGDGLALSRIDHGQFVTRDKAGTEVTHDVARGIVTAVSATSLSVKDDTGTTTTFTVGSATTVRVKGQAKGTTSTIGVVRTSDHVTVIGTGTGPFAATFVRVR